MHVEMYSYGSVRGGWEPVVPRVASRLGLGVRTALQPPASRCEDALEVETALLRIAYSQAVQQK